MSGDKPGLDVYLGTELIAKINLINDQLHWNYSESWCNAGYAISPQWSYSVSPHYPTAQSSSSITPHHTKPFQ